MLRKGEPKCLLNIKGIIDYLPVVACLALLFSSIFYINKFRDLWYAVPVTFLIEYVYNKRWTDFCWDKRKTYYVVMLLFFLLFFAYFPFEKHSQYSEILLRNRVPLLGLAVVGFLGFSNVHKLSYYLNVFVVTSLFSIVYIVFFQIGIVEFITSNERGQLFTTARINIVNSHMMFNLYLNISLVCIWYLFSSKNFEVRFGKKIFYGFAYLIIFYILSISEGRSGFFMSLFITGSFLLLETYKRHKLLSFVILSVFSVFVFFKIIFHPRISGNVGEEPRIFLWKNAYALIKEKPILGWGASEAQHQFTERIWKDTTGTVQTFWKPTDFVDSHNQFIQTSMEFGMLGLFLLIFLYTSPYFIVDKSRKTFCFFIFILLTFQSMFDMFVTGQFASLFMIITFILFFATNDVIKITNYQSKK